MYNFDLSDDNVYYSIHGKCIANLPIDFYGKNIRQISVLDYFDKGEEWFGKLLNPFIYNRDIFGNISKSIGLLELMYLNNKEDFMDSIKFSCSYLFGVDELYIRDRVIEDDNGFQVFIIIGGENCKPEDLLIINNKRFMELKNLVLILSGELSEIHRRDLEKEQETQIKDEKFRERFARYQKNKQQYLEKSKKPKTNRKFNIFRTVVYMQENIDFEKVLKMNIYQLMDVYTNIHIREGYRTRMKIATSGFCSSKDIDTKPLCEKIVK